MLDSFDCRKVIKVAGKDYQFFDIDALPEEFDVHRLPFSIKILLENLLRKEDGVSVTKQDIEKVLTWDPKAEPKNEIAFSPSRVILQDFTGVPAVVDLAVMRDAIKSLKGDPAKINPQVPVELVIDHSVMVDYYGGSDSLNKNTEMEFRRNLERYKFLKWGQGSLDNFAVVPPGTGIVHQVNIEYLARVVFDGEIDGNTIAYPDTLVGTDSHTTMVNGLGVLGWGVGGIEAEAAMLGQPITMLVPQVVGFKLSGNLKEGATATDLVLVIVEMLRKKGVVGKFVEFFGDGLDNLPLADRATIANMAPEYGATCGIFPIDKETTKFLKLSGRDEDRIKLIETYAKAQGMYRQTGGREATYSTLLTLDLNTIEPCIAGPKRPQDRIELSASKASFQMLAKEQELDLEKAQNITINNSNAQLKSGDVVIAAITSCTNTSNPDVMIAAGLLAKKAAHYGIKTKPWVKTSLAPGSQVVTDYYEKAGLLEPLSALGFDIVGYGCTTCIGNSGPLPEPIHNAIENGKLGVCAVLSGNRNFEGRIHPLVKNAYLASPPLVVAYALAGSMNFDFENDPIGERDDGKSVYLKDIWPSQAEIHDTIKECIGADMFTQRYQTVFDGDENWQKLKVTKGVQYKWDDKSTYVKKPSYFDGMKKSLPEIQNIVDARCLALLGDSVTTDHISPAGNIAEDSPAGKYLKEHDVMKEDFNSYGSRRGNHEVMMRGTFANIRLKNLLVPGIEGGVTKYLPTGETMAIYDAAMKYQDDNTPLVVLAGKEYGTGSSRDWAAKGTNLLGVKAVIAQSFERIHRSNLIGMGVVPLEFKSGDGAINLKLTGEEFFSIDLSNLKPQGTLDVIAKDSAGKETTFTAKIRIDTPKEMEYIENGGILHYVIRELID